MEKLINFLGENWDTLASAPLVFIVGVILIGVIVYGVTKWGYGREIKIKDERLKAANDEVARLKEKIAEEKKESLPQQELNGEEESPSTQLEISPEEIDARKFRKAYDMMPELIEEMIQDVNRQPPVREFLVVRKVLVAGTKEVFIYDLDEHESLQGKIHVLENYGFVKEVSRKVGGPNRYRMEEEFVELLRSTTQQEAEPQKIPKGAKITLNPRDPVFSVSAWRGGVPDENGCVKVMLDPVNHGQEVGYITEIGIRITTKPSLIGDKPAKGRYFSVNPPHGPQQVYLPMEIPPRTRDIALELRIDLPWSFDTRQEFAAMLGRLGSYQLTLRYVYEDVDREHFEDGCVSFE